LRKSGLEKSDVGRRASIDRALAAFNPRLPRRGRVRRQAERCLIAQNGIASMKDLRAWCYIGQPFQRWQCWSIKCALWKLGARQIGRAGGIGRPAIYSSPNPKVGSSDYNRSAWQLSH
jgi:hypothetical protein